MRLLFLCLSFVLVFGSDRVAADLNAPQLTRELQQQLRALDAPMRAVRRAFQEAASPRYTRRDVISVFDISKPSNELRFFLIDLAANQVYAYYSSHGQHNGTPSQATRFRNFAGKLRKRTPLGPIKTGVTAFYTYDPGFKTVHDKISGEVYRDKKILMLYGMRAYNEYLFYDQVVGHTKNYATHAWRARYGSMGRSWGCIVLDPRISNEVFERIKEGSLIYVTVGNQLVENFVPQSQLGPARDNGEGDPSPTVLNGQDIRDLETLSPPADSLSSPTNSSQGKRHRRSRRVQRWQNEVLFFNSN